ncbi:PTS mannose/fructose/sorbose transporter subunit IIB [Salmonella enterica subsp. salamae]|uniref:PTS sugar transporter subunit IIB n=2 Tax=Enterobacteriaceae TaxID=543 RepID=A0A5V4Z5F5_SALER|nr:PTS sugar transporter subunit IIB [Citrobacter braakii]EAS9163859.1 PTS mannose/fructose/sorbose transporter subunit IIB [Salmonella enterica]EBQ4753487.1 PTS sugar transporter subunit IIB [Salmonella enterica subsp. diarizonae]ECG2271400.1 PTS mannose/fructose/sorbose transporter subunit IIB [Salmonella enterica subsp. enterica serovar Eastbourne]ECH9563372.1 PTS mannose/fructose/sorbose transporter subunit IIB [Salmonella enterica subsp. salamae]EDX3148141.1 PTS sugar transporter subunit 
MANLNLLRVDERLIHGQIVTSWVARSKADTILIADNLVPDDELQCDLLAMATPPGIELKIFSVRDAVSWINRQSDARVLLLVKTPMVVNELITEGLEISEINVGNMGSKNGRAKYATTLWLTEEEKKEFYKLISHGKKVNLQVLPTDSPVDVSVLLQK